MLITLKDASNLTELPVKSIRELIDSGELKSYNRYGKILIDDYDLLPHTPMHKVKVTADGIKFLGSYRTLDDVLKTIKD
jgi:hypothetical protein